MQCPHCLVIIHDNEEHGYLKRDIDGQWATHEQICPSCKKNIIYLSISTLSDGSWHQNDKFLVYPKGTIRPKAPKEVPSNIAEDYNESCLIINDSTKASAALSRRCLQTILREYEGISKGSLNTEIEQAIKLFPSYISDAIDAIRHIGNFAAHPIKSDSTGEIVEVESGEAQWTLDVLEQLFDFCYVQPKLLQEKRDQLNDKLRDMGKPELKTKKESAYLRGDK